MIHDSTLWARRGRPARYAVILPAGDCPPPNRQTQIVGAVVESCAINLTIGVAFS